MQKADYYIVLDVMFINPKLEKTFLMIISCHFKDVKGNYKTFGSRTQNPWGFELGAFGRRPHESNYRDFNRAQCAVQK